MKKLLFTPLVLLLALAASPLRAQDHSEKTLGEKTAEAGQATKRTARKVGATTKHVAIRARDKTADAARSTAHATRRTARKVGATTQRAARSTVHATKRTARKVGASTGHAADATRDAVTPR